MPDKNETFTDTAIIEGGAQQPQDRNATWPVVYVKRVLGRGWVGCKSYERGAVATQVPFGAKSLRRLFGHPAQQAEAEVRLQRFWRLIDVAGGEGGGDVDRQVELLTERLSRSSVEEIVAFDETLHDSLVLLYQGNLWSVVNNTIGTCYDDSFEYVRGWVICQGEEVSEAAIYKPTSLICALNRGATCEKILYVAKDAYQLKTGMDTGEVWDNWPPA